MSYIYIELNLVDKLEKFIYFYLGGYPKLPKGGIYICCNYI